MCLRRRITRLPRPASRHTARRRVNRLMRRRSKRRRLTRIQRPVRYDNLTSISCKRSAIRPSRRRRRRRHTPRARRAPIRLRSNRTCHRRVSPITPNLRHSKIMRRRRASPPTRRDPVSRAIPHQRRSPPTPRRPQVRLPPRRRPPSPTRPTRCHIQSSRSRSFSVTRRGRKARPCRIRRALTRPPGSLIRRTPPRCPLRILPTRCRIRSDRCRTFSQTNNLAHSCGSILCKNLREYWPAFQVRHALSSPHNARPGGRAAPVEKPERAESAGAGAVVGRSGRAVSRPLKTPNRLAN